MILGWGTPLLGSRAPVTDHPGPSALHWYRVPTWKRDGWSGAEGRGCGLAEAGCGI